MIDLTLDAMKWPVGVDVGVGTQVAMPTRAEAAGNIAMPFNCRAPITVAEDSTTSVIEHDATLVLQGNATLTLGAAKHAGLRVTVLGGSNNGTMQLSWTQWTRQKNCTVKCGGYVELMSIGSGWMIVASQPTINYAVDDTGACNLCELTQETTFAGINRTIIDSGNACGAKVGDYFDIATMNVKGIDSANLNTVQTLTNNVNYHNLRLVIMGFNHYNGVGGMNKDHILWGFQECPFNRRMRPDNTNNGGWATSELRTWLQNSFKADLQRTLGVTLEPIQRHVANNGNQTPLAATLVTDYVLLPSELEVFGAKTYSNEDTLPECVAEMKQWPYYKDGIAPNQASTRRTKHQASNNSTVWWWEESAYYGGATYFCLVNDNGTAGYDSAAYVCGVSPAFVVA